VLGPAATRVALETVYDEDATALAVGAAADLRLAEEDALDVGMHGRRGPVRGSSQLVRARILAGPRLTC
jgi:hypothetical protein